MSNGEQYAVTALGGTQTGVSAHSVSSPFTITAVRPATFRGAGVPNPVTGVLSNVPRNTFKVITRKGVLPLAGQSPLVMLVTTEISVPAGADVADPASVRAALSAHFGTLWAESDGIGDLAIDGVL
jgi:hypothetical protein